MSLVYLLNALIQFALGLLMAFVLGAERFGIYALALAAAIFLQNLVFEWLRLAAIRFHPGDDEAGSRGFFDAPMRVLAAGCLLLAGLALLLGGEYRFLVALVPITALAAGLVDFRAALCRARFDQRGFVVLTACRNAGALVLMPLAAIATQRPELVLLAYAGSLFGAFIVAHLVGGRGQIRSPGHVSLPTLTEMVRYAGPIVLTNLAYLGAFLALRTVIAWQDGLAASGQFSLALDTGLKLVTTLGSALDLFLFQLAVRADRETGREVAQLRLRLNAEMIAAALAALCIGTWLILPSVEIVLIAPSFHGSFGWYLTALLPSLFLYGFIQYVLHPFLQIAHETQRLMQAGFFALLLILAGLAVQYEFLAGGAPALRMGSVLFAGVVAACLMLVARTGAPFVVPTSFLWRTGLALAAMLAAGLWPRSWQPGLTTGLVTGLAASGIFLLVAYALDLARLRLLLRARRAPLS